MDLEKLADPFGFGVGPGTSEEAADPKEPIPTSEHAAGEQVLDQTDGVNVVAPDAEARSSDLDPAMHLQDAPGTWLGEGDAEAAGEAELPPRGAVGEQRRSGHLISAPCGQAARAGATHWAGAGRCPARCTGWRATARGVTP
jgi:hypothetical protein